MDPNNQAGGSSAPKSGIPTSTTTPPKRTSTGTSGIPSRLPTGIKKPTAGTAPATTSQAASSTSSTLDPSTGSQSMANKIPSSENLTAKKPASTLTAESGLKPKQPSSENLTGAPTVKKTIPTTSIPKSSEGTAAKTSLAKTVSSESKAPTSGASTAAATPATDNIDEERQNEIKDLKEKLETLKLKRAEDREKLREIDKLKMQIQQHQEFKTKAQENISSLNKQLQQAQQDTKTAREQFEAYREEMKDFESRLEELTVDKELAEARCEELSEEMEQMKEKHEETKLELDVLKGEIELNGKDGAAATFQSKQTEKEIEHLKSALIKLRDVNVQDKAELNGLRKQSEESINKLKQLTKELESTKSENKSLLAEISELKDQVTASLGSVQMTETLIEKNLDQEEIIAKLKEELADADAMNDLNNQLLEEAHALEEKLREDMDLRDSRLREHEKQIESLKYNIADHERTLLKFRELVKQQQNENDGLARRLKSKDEEIQQIQLQQQQQSNSLTSGGLSSTSGPMAVFDFKKKFIDAQFVSKQIENECNKIELTSSKKYSQLLLSFMPESFVKQSGNNECLLTVVFFPRIAQKCELLLNHFKERIGDLISTTNSDLNDDSMSSLSSLPQVNKLAHSSGQLAYYYEVSFLASSIKLVCDKFDYVLATCDSKWYTYIGGMHYDFSLMEKNLDSVIELVLRDQLDESVSLDGLEKLFNHFQTIYNNYLQSEQLDQCVYLDDLARYGLNASDLISVDLQRLASLLDAKEDSTEIALLFRELTHKINEVRTSVKKIQRNLPKEEKLKKKIVLNFPKEKLAELDTSFSNFFLIYRTLKELYSLAKSSEPTSSDHQLLLSAKKLEQLAYQANESAYNRGDDNGPYENLRISCKQIRDALAHTVASLENGEYESELSDDEFKIRKYQINAPVQKAAEDFKSALVEAENIKIRLEKKDEEIREIKKTFKTKSDELSEQKLRISIVEKKAETQLKDYEEKNKKMSQTIDEMKSEHGKKEKEYSDTIEALQQELDSLENERQTLKEKLRNTAKNKFIENFISRQTADMANGTGNAAGGDPKSASAASAQLISADSTSVLVQENKSLRSVNHLLTKELESVRLAYTDKLLAELPPLPKSNVSNDTQTSKSNEYRKLGQQTDDLLKHVYLTMANVEAVNLKDLSAKKSYPTNQTADKFSYHKAQRKLSELQDQLRSLNKKNSIGASQAESKRDLVAEICINRGPASTQAHPSVIELDLSYQEIREIIRSL